MRREVDKREWAALQTGDAIELAITMTIGGEDVFHIEALAVGIALGLLHAFERVFAFFLGFKYSNGQGFGHLTHLHTEQIVGAPRALATAAFGSAGFNRSRGQDGLERDALAADVALVAQDRVDQVVAGIRLVHAHELPSSP